jgi:hypothetical protein
VAAAAACTRLWLGGGAAPCPAQVAGWVRAVAPAGPAGRGGPAPRTPTPPACMHGQAAAAGLRPGAGLAGLRRGSGACMHRQVAAAARLCGCSWLEAGTLVRDPLAPGPASPEPGLRPASPKPGLWPASPKPGLRPASLQALVMPVQCHHCVGSVTCHRCEAMVSHNLYPPPAGDRHGGATRVLYDTTWSERGVLMCVGRAPRKPSPFDFQPPLVIKTYGALPLFREDGDHRGKKRGREVQGFGSGYNGARRGAVEGSLAAWRGSTRTLGWLGVWVQGTGCIASPLGQRGVGTMCTTSSSKGGGLRREQCEAAASMGFRVQPA